ncbi:MAG: hypothetical protein ACLR31_10200 [Escherichia coli]
MLLPDGNEVAIAIINEELFVSALDSLPSVGRIDASEETQSGVQGGGLI